ncbi:MAG TPA: sigma-70 family RNA polymerase sigma factor [Chloroflexia bacterium]|nr:sigma-70 family RNA polymerase sigma factor [Chloroflexia bacterium]
MDEQQQIQAAQAGQLGAFNDLVGTYEQRVYNLCYRMLGSPDAAADATQDTFLSAYQALARFRGGSFKSWVLRIATNACYDHLRRRQRRPTQSLDQLMGDDQQPIDFPSPDRSGDPEDHALRNELSREIQRALDGLPEDQRLALVLADIQGLSYDEIAEVTHTSLGTVKSRISRARFKMRDLLLGRGELFRTKARHITGS